MSKKTVALLDGDIIAYRIAAMTHEEREWKLVKFELNYYLRETILNNIGATHYLAFFTGRDNFRKELTRQFNQTLTAKTLDATKGTKEYKGSRQDTRPYWWKSIQNYLCDCWGFEFVNGMEADDALAICQKKNSIICSNDHDFLQVPGYHYNFAAQGERKVIYISPQEAHYNLWRQVITGCNTDEVEGIKGYGPATADKFLAPLRPEEYPEAIAELFVKKYGDEGLLRYDLTVKLITLRRTHEGFTPPVLRETPLDINARDLVLKPEEIEDEF